MNGIEKSHIQIPKTPESQRLPYLFKNIVKPNFTSSPAENSKQALGFTRSLVDVAYPEKVVFFYDFTVLVVSVLPNLQEGASLLKV